MLFRVDRNKIISTRINIKIVSTGIHIHVDTIFGEIGMRVVFLEINISREKRIREERLRRFDCRYQR